MHHFSKCVSVLDQWCLRYRSARHVEEWTNDEHSDVSSLSNVFFLMLVHNSNIHHSWEICQTEKWYLRFAWWEDLLCCFNGWLKEAALTKQLKKVQTFSIHVQYMQHDTFPVSCCSQRGNLTAVGHFWLSVLIIKIKKLITFMKAYLMPRKLLLFSWIQFLIKNVSWEQTSFSLWTEHNPQ